MSVGSARALTEKIDMNSDVYRTAPASAGIHMLAAPVDEPFTLNGHDLTDVLGVLPCIPASWSEKVTPHLYKLRMLVSLSPKLQIPLRRSKCSLFSRTWTD
jgi:hypothetical protein